MQCELCERPATCRAVDVRAGVRTRRHWCDEHAELAAARPRDPMDLLRALRTHPQGSPEQASAAAQAIIGDLLSRRAERITLEPADDAVQVVYHARSLPEPRATLTRLQRDQIAERLRARAGVIVVRELAAVIREHRWELRVDAQDAGGVFAIEARPIDLPARP